MFLNFNKFFFLISIGVFLGISTLSANTTKTKNTSFTKQVFQRVKEKIRNHLQVHQRTDALFSDLNNKEPDKEYILLADVTLPYTENFESATVGDPGTLPTGWINDNADGAGTCGSLNAAQCGDWQVHTGATPSTSPIGPDADHTTGSGKYVYYEDSANPNTNINLITPSFDLAGTINPEISIWVYAQSDIGEKASIAGTEENLLHFDVLNSAGTSVIATDITMTVGDNDISDWTQYSINLTDYIGSGEIRLRFRVQNDVNSSGNHDIAIDDFIIQDVGLLPTSAYTCAVASNEIEGKVFEDYDFDGVNDFGESFGLSGVSVTATDSLGNTSSTTTDADGNYTLSSLATNTSYRVEFSNIATNYSPSFHGEDNGTTVQFVQPGNCANLGVLNVSNVCFFRDGNGSIGDSPNWININDTSNPPDGSSYSTVVNGATITHNGLDQVGRGAINYEYWIMDNYIRVRDYLAFLNHIDPTNSTERWEGGLVIDNTITYDDSEPIGFRWKTLDRNVCGQVLTAQEVEEMILNYVAFKVAARFANWIATGDINQGAYTFSNTHSPDADITAIDNSFEGPRLLTEDEIYKALYWDQANLTYNLYGTTTLEANGIPIQSDIGADGFLTVANGNVYGLINNCFKLVRTKQGGQSAYGLYFGSGDYHDMVIPHDVTFPMSSNVVRPNNQLAGEADMRSSYRLNTNLSYDEAFPSPSFRMAANSDPCIRPIEIGNYVWIDADGDGIQDAGEQPLEGVIVALYDILCNEIAYDTTDVNGQYYFNDQTIRADNQPLSINPNDDYLVIFGALNQFNTTEGTLYDTLELTLANTGFGGNPDLNDSDGIINNSGSGTGACTFGHPFVVVNTGDAGYVDNSFDVGFVPQNCSLEIVSAIQNCQDNGTGGDSNDDYFILSLDVAAANGGVSNMFEVINTANNQTIGTGTYDTTLMLEWADMAQTMRFAADGASTYSLMIRDVDDNTCTETITTLSEVSCSNCPPTICLPVKTMVKRNGGTN